MTLLAVPILLLLAALLEEGANWFVHRAADLLAGEAEDAHVVTAARSARQARLLARVVVALAFGIAVAAMPPEERWMWSGAAIALALVWTVLLTPLFGLRSRTPWSLLGQFLFRPLGWAGILARVVLLAGGRLPGLGAPMSSVDRVTELDRELSWLRGDARPGIPESSSEARAFVATLHQFGEALVQDVMVPRESIVALRRTAEMSDIVAVVSGQGYSRYPVYADNLDNVVGMLHVLDLLTASPGATAGQLARPALFTPSTKPVGALLKELQTTYNQMAVVVDEYGGTAGLVTVEDLIEELVGEIEDEHDETPPRIRRLEPGVFWVDATLPVYEVNEVLHLDLEEGEYDTVAGLVLERLERIPKPGERIQENGASIEVLAASPHRIQSLKIRVSGERAGD